MANLFSQFLNGILGYALSPIAASLVMNRYIFPYDSLTWGFRLILCWNVFTLIIMIIPMLFIEQRIGIEYIDLEEPERGIDLYQKTRIHNDMMKRCLNRISL